MTVVKIKNTSNYPNPAYSTELSSGLDLRACITEPIFLEPLERILVGTGIFLEIPEGYEAQIRPRSGFALKKGITVLNSPGTIDADYRGEVGVILINLGNERVTIEPGERICQMVFSRYEKIKFESVEIISETIRGNGGFGHTGIK